MNTVKFKIGGKERSFRFGTYFLSEILQHFDTDVTGFGLMVSKNPFAAIPSILYFSHRYEVNKSGKEVDFNIMDVSEWIDELENGFSNNNIENILNILIDTIRANIPGLEEEGESSKKK